jgi:hypothetical protein
MTVREKTIKYELLVTVPENYKVEPITQLIELAMRWIKEVRGDEPVLSGLYLIEEGEAHEVIK